MKKDDLGLLQSKIESDLIKSIVKNKKLFKAGNMDLSKYDYKFLQQREHSYYLNNDYSLDTLLQKLNEIKETEEANLRLGLRIDFEVCSGSYEGDSPSTSVKATWYELLTEPELKIPTYLNHQLRSIVSSLVFVRAKELGTIKFEQQIDCKLLSLFKEDKIDFDTLVSISYTDCSI
jgi:hypothetical protein